VVDGFLIFLASAGDCCFLARGLRAFATATAVADAAPPSLSFSSSHTPVRTHHTLPRGARPVGRFFHLNGTAADWGAEDLAWLLLLLLLLLLLPAE